MAIKHPHTAVPNEVIQSAFWNADHIGTATPDNHGNEAHVPDFQEILPIGSVLMYNGTGIANVATRTVQLGDEPGDTITLTGWFACNGNSGTPNILNKFIRGMSASGNTGGSDDALAHTHAFTQPSGHSNHVFTQPSSHAATACSRTTDIALTNNHSGGAVAAGGVDHYHGVSINSGWISADHVHTVIARLYTSAGGYLYQQYVDHAWTCNLRNTASASGAYTDARDRGIACSVGGVSANHYHYVGGNTGTASAYSHGHGFTQPSAHAITQPTFNTPVLSHSGGAVDAHSAHAGGAVGAVNESLTNANMPAYYSLIFIIRMS